MENWPFVEGHKRFPGFSRQWEASMPSLEQSQRSQRSCEVGRKIEGIEWYRKWNPKQSIYHFIYDLICS